MDNDQRKTARIYRGFYNEALRLKFQCEDTLVEMRKRIGAGHHVNGMELAVLVAQISGLRAECMEWDGKVNELYFKEQ